jgi:hypothetical protein
MSKALDKARAKRSEQSSEKRAYVRSLLTGDPQLEDRTLEQLVVSKFGSGLSRRNMDDVRKALGWVWERGEGRSRRLVRADAVKSAAAPQQPAQGAQAAKPVEGLTEDEQREVELIAQLQALMTRQGYQQITIPVIGTARIDLLVRRAKIPGEHVTEQVAALH